MVTVVVVGMMSAGCAHRSGSRSLGYWDGMAELAEAFEADPQARVKVRRLGLSEELSKTLDADGDGRIVLAEYWAHQEASAARPYRGPRDMSESSGHREGGFPLNLNPEIISAEDSDLGEEDLVIGIVIGDEARAYPVNYMNGPLNEVVNDTLGGEAIASTW